MGHSPGHGRWNGHRSWQPYAAAVIVVLAATLAGVAVSSQVAPTNLVMLYLLGVVIVGLRWGRGPAVLCSIVGVSAFDFFFVPPYLTLAVDDAQYLITFAALLLVALVIGTLTGRLRDHAAVVFRREQETAALYAFARSMVAARDTAGIAEAVVGHISGTLKRPVALLLRETGPSGPHTATFGAALAGQDLAAATWALAQGEPAGAGRGGVPAASVICMPLKAADHVIGVLVVGQVDEEGQLRPDERRLLEAFAVQVAVVAERAQLAEAARQTELLLEAEKLHDTLLNSVSHALRTPLAAIIGSLSALMDSGEKKPDPATRRDLMETAREEAERLNWLVSNLLDMTRLESGHLRLTVDWYDLDDVIGAALSQTVNGEKQRPIEIQMEPHLPLVPLDQVLIVQVLVNLLHNAAKYSGPGSPISIEVRKAGENVAVTVADRGIGIPPGECERVFEKFYRVDRSSNPAGIGLGLAICRGIVEAHRGRIRASPREGGGTAITFTLPLQGRSVDLGGDR